MEKELEEKVVEEEIIKEKEDITEKEISLEKDEIKEKIELSWEEKYNQQLIENANINDKMIRRAAEFENFRRRNAADKSNWIKNATERVMMDVCDVVDNFERALHPDLKKTEPKAFQKGIKLIYQQLENVLSKEGVKKIKSEKTEFDPNIHEAIAHIPSDLAENMIVAVIQNGYKMNDKVIRPARVAVSNGIKPEKPSKEKKKK